MSTEDCRAAFGLGTDDKHIATVDADGVALAAIQGLNQIVREREAEVRKLKAANAAIERPLAALEQLIAQSQNLQS